MPGSQNDTAAQISLVVMGDDWLHHCCCATDAFNDIGKSESLSHLLPAVVSTLNISRLYATTGSSRGSQLQGLSGAEGTLGHSRHARRDDNLTMMMT